MARILFVLDRDINAETRGELLRHRGILTALGTLGHEVIMLPLADNPTNGTLMLEKAMIPSLFHRPVRFMTNRRWSSLTTQVDSIRPDLLLLNHPQFADYVVSTSPNKVPTILITQNFEFSLQMMRSLRRPFLHHVALGIGEYFYLRRASRVWAVSDADRIRYQSWYNLRNVATIPNALPRPVIGRSETTMVPEILFVGAFSYRPNEVAANFLVQNVMPIIWKVRADVRLMLVGHSPSNRMQKLISPNICVTGTVDDLTEYYNRASVVVVPVTMGGGTKYKFLEAMSYGKAIVSTAKGAEGICVVPRKDFLLSKTKAKAFANNVLALLDNKSVAEQLGKSAQSVFLARYSQEKLTSLIAKELMFVGIGDYAYGGCFD